MSSFLLLGAGTDAAVGGGGGSTVVFDAISTTNNGGVNMAGLTLTWTHTPVGTPTAVVVCIASFSTNPTGVTYGGAAMTQLATTATNGSASPTVGSMWGLAHPASGAQSVVATYAGSGTYPNAYAMTVTGSDTVTCFRGNGTAASGSGSSVSVTETGGLTNDLIVGLVAAEPGAETFTAGGGVTNRQANSIGGVGSEVSTAAGSASVAMTWTASSTSNWFALSAAIKHG